MEVMSQAVYDAIVDYWRAFCVPPTTRWLAVSLHRSASVIHYHQRKLGKLGLLVRAGRHWVPAEIKQYLSLFTPKGVKDERN